MPKRTFGNHRRYAKEQLDNYMGICNEEEIISESKINEIIIRHPVAYARVSTQKQDKEGNLDRQAERLEHFIITSHPKNTSYSIIKEYGSGLNPMRRGLQRLIKAVMDGKVSQIYVEFPDRLTRFGYPFLKTLFEIYHVPIIHTENPPQTSIEQQLLEDMMTLMACFSGRLYKNRSLQQLYPNLENDKITRMMEEFIEKEENKINRCLIRKCLQNKHPIPSMI